MRPGHHSSHARYSRRQSPGGHSGRTGEGQALATELNAVSCDGASCVAVGMYLAANNQVLTLAERWNGTSWRLLHPISARAPISVLYGVSCNSAQVCMAVGGSQWTRQYPLAESWRNGRWHLVPGGKVAGGTLNGVSCPFKLRCIAVGAVCPVVGAGDPGRVVGRQDVAPDDDTQPVDRSKEGTK